jgi:hypothetical protein
MRKKLCQLFIWHRVNWQNRWRTQKNIKEANNTIDKWTVLKRSINVHYIHEVLNILCLKKEIQIKTTVRPYLTTVRMAIIKKIIANAGKGGGENGPL